MGRIRGNLEEIRGRMERAAARAGRDPDRVRLVAVSKRVGLDQIREAISCGQRLFGENYLQEARDKIAELGDECDFHYIGHLQSNKSAEAAGLFSMIETVDRVKIARILDRAAAESGKILPILVQVNIGREEQKSGVFPEEAEGLFAELADLPNLAVRGLMVMPPLLDDPESVRPYFRQTRELSNRLSDRGLLDPEGNFELSMGMSGDYEVAVEEGATLVRVGTALFGERS